MRTLRVVRWLGFAAWAPVLAALSCSEDRAGTSAPTFEADVAPILKAKCASCHGGATPASGFRVDTYLETIACVPGSAAATSSPVPATLPADETAPLVAALSTAPHVGLVSNAERKVLVDWIRGGAIARTGAAHPAGIVDPRSPDFHGRVLRAGRYTQMLDATSSQACGLCHDGAPARPAKVTAGAPGATACTTCHSDERGPLACNTCHGSGSRIYPGRDPCFFPDDKGGAHAKHVEPSSTHAGGIACATCHPMPTADVISGRHGNGSVDVSFDVARAGPEVSYDPSTQTCAVTCHDRGGTAPRPTWAGTGAKGCNGCHSSPPAKHYPGTCTTCHAEANADGTALTGGPLHVNGRVDLGNGNGTCSACHGKGTSPYPQTAAHPSHESPTLSSQVACESCHPVPSAVSSPGHLNGTVEIAFTGRAAARASTPVWNGSTCAGVACHGAGLDTPRTPAWKDGSHAESACGTCHGIPPQNHTPASTCESAVCHGAEVAPTANGMPMITESGRALHVNGSIDHF